MLCYSRLNTIKKISLLILRVMSVLKYISSRPWDSLGSYPFAGYQSYRAWVAQVDRAIRATKSIIAWVARVDLAIRAILSIHHVTSGCSVPSVLICFFHIIQSFSLLSLPCCQSITSSPPFLESCPQRPFHHLAA